MAERREPTLFELEREKLVHDIAQNLASLISSTNTLNRNIEATVAVGSQFDGAARLWKEYGRVMASSGDEKEQQSSVQDVSVADDTFVPLRQEDSFGLAPGAGSTSYMQ